MPTTTLPKLMLDGLTASDPGVVPVPLTGMERVGFEASELRVRAPLELPLAVGAKVTLNVKFWPGVNMTGGVMPLAL